jgi:hemerythrin superfamily protein
MTQTSLPRRSVMLGAAATALLPMREAIAQSSLPEGADWFTMVQTHHAMVAKTLDALVAAKTTRQRTVALNLLGYQLSAHSLAEENTIYPMLAMNGIDESDKLYMDQAHAKVMNAQLDTWAALEQTGPEFTDTALKLQAAVLKHAKQDEEGNLYPQLRSKLSQTQNNLLTANYKVQFGSVKPVKAV